MDTEAYSPSSRHGTKEPKGAATARPESDQEGKSTRHGPTPEDVEAWAERERVRRQMWTAGPTEEEKLAWACRERERRSSRSFADKLDSDLEDDPLAQRLRRDAELASFGALSLFMDVPFLVLSRLIRAGRSVEASGPLSRGRRVPFFEEDF